MKKRHCKRFCIPGTTLTYRKKPILFFKSGYFDQSFPVVNLSKGGLMFLSDLKFTPGRAIILKIDIPGTRPVPEIHARIRWISRNREASYKYRTGISFNPYGKGRYENPEETLSILNALEEAAGRSGP